MGEWGGKEGRGRKKGRGKEERKIKIIIPLCIVGGNIKWCSPVGNRMVVHQSL